MKEVFTKNIFIIFIIFNWSIPCFSVPFQGTKFVVSGPSPYAPSIAKNIFKQKGNIIDMASAIALSLSVTHPYYVSLGSGGFALVKMNSSIRALDFREAAPYKMKSDFFQKSKASSQQGGASVGIPGFVAGIFDLHRKYGKLSWFKILEPSIKLAEEGFPVSGEWVVITKSKKNKFNSVGKNIFLKKGKLHKPNEILKQKGLAQALRQLQKNGKTAFYEGAIGRDIISTLKKEKSLMTEEDLKKYKVRWLKPVSIFFKDYKINSMPLPSSGGIILGRALKLIEKLKLSQKKIYSLDEMHLLGEIMARAFLPRALMGDPDFSVMDKSTWLSKQAIDQASQTISIKKTKQLPPLKESGETTHISLIDAHGNAVAMTLTLNGLYGSYLVSEKYGIVLNNQMDDFTTHPNKPNMFGLIQGENNVVKGGKRPLSSMTPTIVEKGKERTTVMALGAGGGPMIITSVLQTIYRHLVHGMDIEKAVLSSRLHHQFLPRTLFVERKKFNPELIEGLKKKGHKIQLKDYIAQVFAVSRNENGILSGANESRKESASGGL